jgi:hypothetical protein
MRTPKGTRDDEGTVCWNQSHDAMNLCRFETLLEIHVRKDRGQ